MNDAPQNLAINPIPVKKSSRFVNLTGRRFGRLLVLGYHGKSHHSKSTWVCLCDCGVKRVIVGGSMMTGLTQSCGCYLLQRITEAKRTHGKSGTLDYNLWVVMISRCENKNFEAYRYYGARGIKVCKRWRDSFENFIADMGPRPNSSRKPVDGDSWDRLPFQTITRRRTQQGDTLNFVTFCCF